MTPQDIRNHANLLADQNSGGKAVLWSCLAAWACSAVNADKVTALGLDDVIELRDPGSSANLFAMFEEAVANGEFHLGYIWSPTKTAITLDLTILEEPECGPDQEPGDGCAFPTADVMIAAHPSLVERAPRVVEMLLKYHFPAAEQIEAETYRADTGASFAETAIFWLENNQAVWTQWVPADVAEKIADGLPQ